MHRNEIVACHLQIGSYDFLTMRRRLRRIVTKSYRLWQALELGFSNLNPNHAETLFHKLLSFSNLLFTRTQLPSRLRVLRLTHFFIEVTVIKDSQILKYKSENLSSLMPECYLEYLFLLSVAKSPDFNTFRIFEIALHLFKKPILSQCFFCDGTRRYGVPAPFPSYEKNLLYACILGVNIGY